MTPAMDDTENWRDAIDLALAHADYWPEARAFAHTSVLVNERLGASSWSQLVVLRDADQELIACAPVRIACETMYAEAILTAPARSLTDSDWPLHRQLFKLIVEEARAHRLPFIVLSLIQNPAYSRLIAKLSCCQMRARQYLSNEGFEMWQGSFTPDGLAFFAEASAKNPR